MIVVIGAGLVGLAIAHELALRGATVRVIDAGEPAGAASWAGAGMLAPFTESLGHGPYEDLCARSLALYPAFVRALFERGGVDARLRLDGILEVAFAPCDAARLRERVARRSAAARYLARDEVLRLEPALSGGVVGAAFCEAEGSVDNRRLGRALLAACAALDVRVDAHVPGVALEADARRVLGVRGPDGFIPATQVVNATGAWAGSLRGVPDRARVPVVPVKGQMLALAMPRDFVRRTTWVPGAYLVPRNDGRLLVGATVEAAGFDRRVTARGVRALLEAALTGMPALAELSIAETWAGLRPGTPDGLPYLGETEIAGYYVASGHYRNGILLAPVTAALMADALAGNAAPSLAPFSPRRAAGAAASNLTARTAS